MLKLSDEQRRQWAVDGYLHLKGVLNPDEIASVADRCTPRQRRLLGDLGHDGRPGDFFYAPTDQKEVILQA